MPTYVPGSGKEIIFSDFAPDKDPATLGILLDANNAVPTMKGYIDRNAPVAIPNGMLPGSAPTTFGPYGAYIADFPSSLIGFPDTISLYGFVGGVPYQLQAGGWVNVSGGSSFFIGTSPWSFTQFQNDVIATNGGQTLIATGPSGNFAVLGGLPFNPLVQGAQVVLSVGGFVILFVGPSWYSSAAGSDTNFTPNIQTLAATGTLYDKPGNVTAAAALYRSIVAFKSGATWIGTFSGAPFTWSFQLISNEVGTWSQGCVVTLPDSVAFLGTDDFYITTGYTPQRIPNSLKEWFFATARRGSLNQVQSWYDHVNSVIYWHFTSNSCPPGVLLDRYVAYNVRVGRWSTGYLNCSVIVPNTQDNTSPLVGANGGTAEGGYFFDPSNNLMTWDSNAGAVPGTGYVKTGFHGDESNVSQLLRFRAKWNQYPPADSGQALHLDILGSAPTLNTNVVKGFDDWYSVRQIDRWHQVQINFAGGGEIVGYAFEARLTGTRGGGSVAPPMPVPPPPPMTPLFIAVGNNNLIVTSPDGVAWTTRNPDDSSGFVLDAVASDGNKTLVVAPGTGIQLFTSKDGGNSFTNPSVPAGTNWGFVPTVNGLLQTIIYDSVNKRFATVAWNGTLTPYAPTITTIAITGGLMVAHFASLSPQPPVGYLASISGNSNPKYNSSGLQVISTTLTSISLAFATPTVPGGGNNTVTPYLQPTGFAYTVSLTGSSAGIKLGDSITISGNTNPSFNGVYIVTNIAGTSIQITNASGGLVTGTGGTFTDNSNTYNITSISLLGATGWIYQVQTLAFSSIAVGDTIVITGNSNTFFNATNFTVVEVSGQFIRFSATAGQAAGTGGYVVDTSFSGGTGGTITLPANTPLQGLAATSVDGLAWSFNNLNTNGGPGQFIAIAFNGTQYVALELGGRFYASPDMVNWTLIFVPGSGAGYGWLGVNTRRQFLALGSNFAAYSNDGLTWNEAQNAPQVTDSYTQVIWDIQLNLWIATCALPNGHAGIMTSPDGATWMTRLDVTPGASTNVWASSVLRAMGGSLYAYTGYQGAGQFGQWYTSPDGVTWTSIGAISPATLPHDVVWSGTLFVGQIDPDVGDQELATSFNALSWTQTFDDTNADIQILRKFP